MSFLIIYQVFHGKPFPVPASCSLPGRGNSLTRVSRRLCEAADLGQRSWSPASAVSFQQTFVHRISEDPFSQHTLIFQGQILLSSSARRAWAAEDKSDKLANRE